MTNSNTTSTTSNSNLINSNSNLINSFFNAKKVQFVSFTYKNVKNEISKYTVLINVNYINSLHKDLIKLNNFTVKSEIEKLAKTELQDSLINSIYNIIIKETCNDNYTKKNYYEKIENLKIHDNMLYLNSYIISKKILENKFEYKKIKSSEKTLAKNRIKRDLRVSKFREFKLDISKIKNVSINKNRLLFDCV